MDYSLHIPDITERIPYEEHNLFSVTLGELIEDEIFKWEDIQLGKLTINLDWEDVAYNKDMYTRICNMFTHRYYWDEISITPPGLWMQTLAEKIRFELCPKFNAYYAYRDYLDGLISSEEYNILTSYDKFGKSRNIASEFPETLLSNNSDYASNGQDQEYEEVNLGSPLEHLDELEEMFTRYKDLDEMFIDSLRTMFNIMYTYNYNNF